MQTTSPQNVQAINRSNAGSDSVPLRQAAYDRIEALLNQGVLRPGQMVTQRELVELTGATLGSIREAVPRFEAEGLLQTVPKRGLMVPSLDVSFVREAYQMRRMIEISALPDVIGRLGDATLTEMIDWHQNALSRLDEDEGSADELAHALQAYDWKMHETFVGTMHNSLIANVYRVTAIKIRMAVQSRIQVTSYNAYRVIHEHLHILEALRKRDIESARSALLEHLNNSLKLALGGTVE